jgi:hypothetical protein
LFKTSLDSLSEQAEAQKKLRSSSLKFEDSSNQPAPASPFFTHARELSEGMLLNRSEIGSKEMHHQGHHPHVQGFVHASFIGAVIDLKNELGKKRKSPFKTEGGQEHTGLEEKRKSSWKISCSFAFTPPPAGNRAA